MLTPIAVGVAFGYGPLGSYLAGAIAAGVLMASVPGLFRWHLG